MYRSHRHKIVVYHGEELGESYGRQTDPQEFTNPWDDPSSRQLCDELTRRCFDNTVFTMDPEPPRVSNYRATRFSRPQPGTPSPCAALTESPPERPSHSSSAADGESGLLGREGGRWPLALAQRSREPDPGFENPGRLEFIDMPSPVVFDLARDESNGPIAIVGAAVPVVNNIDALDCRRLDPTDKTLDPWDRQSRLIVSLALTLSPDCRINEAIERLYITSHLEVNLLTHTVEQKIFF
jgi:hypothetical protein